MGQVLHGSAKTTHAVRTLIQRSKASTAALSRELGINVKTVAKWRKRQSVEAGLHRRFADQATAGRFDPLSPAVVILGGLSAGKFLLIRSRPAQFQPAACICRATWESGRNGRSAVIVRTGLPERNACRFSSDVSKKMR